MFRKVVGSDASQIHRILSGLAAGYPFPFGSVWTLPQVEAECRESGFVEVDAQGGVQAFVLYREMGDVWEISFIATADQARGQGVARALLRRFLEMKPADKRVWLEVHELNGPARRLYESAGFTEVSRRPRYYPDGAAAVLYNYG